MTLDLTILSRQVRQMSRDLAQEASSIEARRAQLCEAYLQCAGDEETLAQKVDMSRGGTLLLARPVPGEPLDLVRDVPFHPSTYRLVATDGSQIEVDHHGIATFYLLNMGRVYLRYGEQPVARLSSRPALFYREDDLYITDGARRVAVEGNYLAARRDLYELQTLEELSKEFFESTRPFLALLDGTLMRWTLAGAERFIQEALLMPYLESLERLRTRHIPVASYISRSRANEVVGMVRLIVCPDIDLEQERGARCPQCQTISDGENPPCHLCNDMVDTDLFFGRLREGQRGPLFTSMSRVNIESYESKGPHRVHFFYLRVGREMARVEVPRWIAEDATQVDLVHSLVYDQCVRGQGYPVALARAHEQAVVRSADRRTFERMVEGCLVQAELPVSLSMKQEKKELSSA